MSRPLVLGATVVGTRDTKAVRTAVLTAIVLVAVVVRIFPLTYSHFWDETVFLQHAKILVDPWA